jgi:hypothetical protein
MFPQILLSDRRHSRCTSLSERLNRAVGLELFQRREKNIIDLLHTYLELNIHAYRSNSLVNIDNKSQVYVTRVQFVFLEFT